MNVDIAEIYRQWRVLQIRDPSTDKTCNMNSHFETYYMKYKKTIYQSALSLFHALNSLNSKKSYQNEPISIKALKYFQDFADKNKEIINEAFWDVKIALQAFEFAIDTENETWIKIICKCYGVDDVPEEERINLVKKTLEVKKFSSAAWFALYAKVISKIPIENICGPLICQSKVTLVEQLMKHDQLIAESVVQYIDQFVDNVGKLQTLAENIPCANFSMLNVKSINKLAKRLAREYRIPVELCPRTDYSAKMTAIKFLIRRKFIELKPMDKETWQTMFDSILDPNNPAGDMDIVKELIYDLTTLEQFEEARRWANLYHIPENEWPELLLQNPTESNREYPIHDNKKIILGWDPELTDVETETNEVKIPDTKITFVDSHEAFKAMNSYIYKRHSLIAMDTEWKPNLGLISEPETRAALIQIACGEKIYVIDAIALRFDIEWKKFVDCIINNPALLKIGFAIQNDIIAISGLLSHMDVKPDPECFIDYADFHNWLVQSLKIQLPDYPPQSGGLSKLAYAVLGKYLIKTDQYTNWEIRPLTADKITYAATDAFVLLEIHEKLEDWCQTRGLNYEMLMHKFLARNPNRVKRFFIREVRENTSNFCFPPTILKDIKFIVDPRLSHLGALLRFLGVDVVIPVMDTLINIERIALSQSRKYITVVDIGEEERRIISKLPHGWTFELDTKLPIFEKLMNICMKFNLLATDKFLYTRCCRCNYHHLITIDKFSIELWKEKGEILREDIEIAYHLIPEDDKIKVFYICYACGMVYWKGKYYKKVKKWIKSLILLGLGSRNPHEPTLNPQIDKEQARIKRFCF